MKNLFLLFLSSHAAVLNDERDHDKKGSEGWLKYAAIMRCSAAK